MPSPARRTFVQTAFAGAAVAALGAALPRAARAAELPKDLKFALDPKQPQPGLEAAHTPLITLEKLDPRGVAYGKTPAGDFYRVTVQARHEATAEHHIHALDLYVNGERVAGQAMNRGRAEASLPVASFVQRLKAGDELLAVTQCNLHGLWGGRATV